ncbi:uncharacterized protein MELLADRAFT_113613 [Melampsora larici-populina 98AG31]|uniref:Uncharacterized protein n=1 Tax=Melampsora larici-populina (strain 98AG31 / pathotype 3-4-7) TaxID=747676 RepID=F4SAH4_MELLP|nr:uncharacterized protein MELLADRAFT_113613 [Melampsora larici-populina 98AG31]EGF98327.1 hypothetical protein MELLADRAFT_113613 [Melampsora larici-populina 98AG31]
MAEQGQASTKTFNKDVQQILKNHDREMNQQEDTSTTRGKGKATRGRGRGGRRGRGGATSTRPTRSATKGKIRKPKDATTEDEDEELTELEEVKEDEEGDRSINGSVEGDKEDEEEVDEIISLGDEAEFVMESAHIEREHNHYAEELMKLYRKGKTGRFQMLKMSYEEWCKKNGSKPRMIQMLGCSSDEEEEQVSGAVKRKSKAQDTDKPIKIGKTMNPGKVLTHRLIELSAYWNNKMVACFGYVPLTIFVPAWLLADTTHMANRRKQSSSCSNVLSYVDEQITAVTGGRMLSHLATPGRSHHEHGHTQSNGQHHHDNFGNHVGYDDHEQSGSHGGVSNGRGRGKRGRGRGNGHGVSGRGGIMRTMTQQAPTTMINGVAVPKFGPGAFEALKAARQAGTSNSAGSQQSETASYRKRGDTPHEVNEVTRDVTVQRADHDQPRDQSKILIKCNKETVTDI